VNTDKRAKKRLRITYNYSIEHVFTAITTKIIAVIFYFVFGMLPAFIVLIALETLDGIMFKHEKTKEWVTE
jgi:cobalamin biosynthesis protein CobD/CbiB